MCQSKVQDSNDEARSDMAEVQDSKGRNNEKKQGGTKNHPYFFVCFLGVWAILLILTIYRSNQKPRPKNSPKKTQPPFFRLCGLAHVLRQQP